MARERFSFDDTIEFDKDELKPIMIFMQIIQGNLHLMMK